MITGDIGNEISCADLIPADDRTGTVREYHRQSFKTGYYITQYGKYQGFCAQ